MPPLRFRGLDMTSCRAILFSAHHAISAHNIVRECMCFHCLWRRLLFSCRSLPYLPPSFPIFIMHSPGVPLRGTVSEDVSSTSMLRACELSSGVHAPYQMDFQLRPLLLKVDQRGFMKTINSPPGIAFVTPVDNL